MNFSRKNIAKLYFLPTIFAVVLMGVSAPAASQTSYTYKMTSGPFVVVQEAAYGSLDWVLINNDNEPVDVAVTVYHYVGGQTKERAPNFTLEVSIEPGHMLHNANSVAPNEIFDSTYFVGYTYEVVIEATSDKVHAMVTQWFADGSDSVIPETVISAGDFVEIPLPKDKGKS